VERVQERRTRILEIASELGVEDGCHEPVWTDEEKPERVLRVTDDQIDARPYETEAMRIAREAAEEARRKREAEAQADDSKDRALHDMMHGTLEASDKQDFLEEAPEPPEWIDTVPLAVLSTA